MIPRSLAETVAVHKALAHPSRLRILAMLRGGELCVCQIIAVLQAAPSTVSAHLAELKRADLLRERKDGRWVRYRLAGQAGDRLDDVWRSLAADQQIVADAAVLDRLRRLSPEDVCRAEMDLTRLGIAAHGAAGES